MTSPSVLVELTRDDNRGGRSLVESVHRGHVAIVDGDGDIIASIGDPEHLTYHRSAVKPFQAAAALEIIAASGADVSDLCHEEVAVGWGSHTAEDVHLAAVERLLVRAGLAESELTCPPADREAARGSALRRLHFNCSGKHALFGWAGEVLGVPRDMRLDPNAKLQQRILAELEQSCGPVQAVGVDGCGAPAIAGPLVGLARGFASLRRDDRHRRIVEAGLAAPVLVGGSARAESALLAAGVVAKPGAEGVFAVAFDRADGSPVAAAIKIEDGADRAAATAAVALVAAFGGPVVNWHHEVLGGGLPQGRCRATAVVSDVAAGL